MSERRRPDLDQVRESLRERDERAEDDDDHAPKPAGEPQAEEDEGESEA